MPRIVPYNDPEAGAYDLAGGLAGGILQGYAGQLMTQQERDRQQREAATGNPYERAKRAATWASLPEDIRSSPNAAMFQNLVAGGADPVQVIGAHREMSTDPAYGDPKTQASRKKALEVAMRAGHVKADDEATKEAVLRGELTLGKMLGRKESQAEKEADRTYSEGLAAKTRTEKEAKDAQRAGLLQQQLGVGQATPPTTRERTPEEGGYLYADPNITTPGQPGVPFTDPEDVKAVASHARQKENAETAASQKERALAIQQQRVDQAKQTLARASGRSDLTPEQRTRVEAALEVMNDATATAGEYSQAFVVAREFGFAPQAAAIQKQSPQEEAQLQTARADYAQLKQLETNMMGPNGDDWVNNYASKHGIKATGVSPLTGKPIIDKKVVLDHIAAQIAALAQQMGGVPPAAPSTPAGTPAEPTNNSPDPAAAAAVDAMLRALQPR